MPESDAAYFARLAPELAAHPQRGAGLGERMDNAFADAFAQDGPVVIIGSDLPSLPAAHVRDAFARLDAGADLALGPAKDGGYYLIGLRARQPRLLREPPMSAPTLLADTLALAAELGLRAELLPA